MLQKLKVQNLAVVESAEACFAPGLNVITGETGAGKSVLMGALDLLLGGRADVSVIRDGAKEAEVEATFTNHVVRRTLTREGRSRAWVDEESVTIAELRELGGTLVDIHGPRANQQLLEESFQREILDRFGSVKRTSYDKAYAQLAGLRQQRAKLDEAIGDDELEFLRFQVNELENAALSDDDETVAARHAAAAHAEENLENANAITEALGGDESAAAILAALQPRLHTLARHFPMAESWVEKTEALTLELQELSRTIADATATLSEQEEDLETLDARLTLLNRLTRKYLKGFDDTGAGRILALRKIRDEKRARLDAFEGREARLSEIDQAIAKAAANVRVVGAALTRMRRKAADALTKTVTRELRDLGFNRADFSVTITEISAEPHGCDRITYLFAPNPGEATRPLAEIASSGEIARVMLALKAVTASKDDEKTLVFDEIDANIGGEVGRVVGEKMRTVANSNQVIAITHLPQCAVFGERHLVVKKNVSNGRTRTQIDTVEGTSRISEIARMLGGEKLTSVVRKHAEELLNLSR